jgi:DNA-binding SARP family transcriptional activator
VTTPRIQLCGGLAVVVSGRDVTTSLPGRQGRALVAYLALNSGHAVARDELIEALWEETLPGAPESALSSLLTGLRRVLGRDALVGRSHLALRLEDGAIDLLVARADGAEAEAALAAGEYVEALRLARGSLDVLAGPLLPEIDQRWAQAARIEAEQLRVDQLEVAARAALTVSPPELVAAERLAEELTEREPYRESGYALRMEALAAAGNVAEALRVYDGVRVLLRDELGATPAASLTALNERLLIQGGVGTPVTVAEAAPAVPLPSLVARAEARPFVGRRDELERLRERWALAERGEGGLVIVTGEAGMGKTRLASRLAASVHGAGGAVLYGRADEETVVPYQPFTELLRQYFAHTDLEGLRAALGHQLDELRPLVPELGGDPEAVAEDVEARRFALFEAVSAVLRHAAADRPLLIILDDLHWADTPTLLLLRQTVREAEGARMLVLGTYRDVEIAQGAPLTRVLGDLRREQVVARVAVTGLDRDGTAALMAARGDHAWAPDRLWEYTAGNPFFIEELLRDGVPVPESVQDLLSRRLDRLGAETVEVLTNAAVIGPRFTLAALESLMEEPVSVLFDALEAAGRAGLVAEDAEQPERFSFSHALVRETLYAKVAASRKRRMHLRAGLALESLPERSVAELARHFYAAREIGGGERAVDYAVAAAAEAEGAHAYEQAARQYERALSVLDDEERERRIELLLALGAVRWKGSEPGARRAYEQAAELARERGAAGALARAALGMGGRFYSPEPFEPAYVSLLQDALAGVAPDSALRPHLLGRLAETETNAVAVAYAEDAVAAARALGDDAALLAALLSRHAALLGVEHNDERRAVAEEAVALADRREARELGALARHWLIYDLVEADELDAAATRHSELERVSRDLGQPLYRHAALAWRGVWAQLAGRHEEVERLAREGLRLAQRAGTPTAQANFTAQLLAARSAQGRLGELTGEIERLVAAGSLVVPWHAVLPLAWLQAGDRDHARDAFEAAVRGPVPHRMFWLTATAWLAEAAGEGLGEPGVFRERLAPFSGRLVQASFTGNWGPVSRLL